jgi:hypothetical protein
MSLMGRYCRKKILGAFPSNIDSREEANTQHRFKILFVLIPLLRSGRVLPTFSTASVKSGKAHTEQILSAFTPLATFERTCRDVGLVPRTEVSKRRSYRRGVKGACPEMTAGTPSSLILACSRTSGVSASLPH